MKHNSGAIRAARMRAMVNICGNGFPLPCAIAHRAGTTKGSAMRPYPAYLLPAIAPISWGSKDDGAETQSGLRADPGAVPGAST
jgi:hypothetical protein